MQPGYYLAVREGILTGPKRIRIHKGDWLVTDGTYVGRFDKTEEFDWIPLEWVRGNPVVLDETTGDALGRVTAEVPAQRLEAAFHKLMFIEPGEPLPDLPKPSLGQLETYLRNRRGLVAASYTYRRP